MAYMGTAEDRGARVIYLQDHDLTIHQGDALETLRMCVGIELAEKYSAIAARRTQQLSLAGDVAQP